MQKFWQKISANKTPGTMPVSEEFWKKFKPGDHILEVGCAWGRIVFECLKRDFKVTGIDINSHEVNLLQKRLKEQNISTKEAKIKVSDILSSKFKEGTFSGAILLGVLAGMPIDKRIKCLKEVCRILKPDGVVYIGEFELNTSDPVYRKRYEEDMLITGEFGTLSVKDDSGEELYRTHNFSVDEISKTIIESGLTLESVTKSTFISYHGNKKPGIMIIARK